MIKKIWQFVTLTPYRQSGRKIRAAAIAVAGVLAGLPVAAGQVDWAHQNGSLQSGGQVTVRAASGATYSATQNPGGAVAKANQSAATQPVTVQIQATTAGVFSYTNDCYLLTLAGASGTYLGAGKLDAANNFTGLVGQLGSGGADLVMNALMQFRMFDPNTYGGKYYGYCATGACLNGPTYSYNYVYSVVSMSTVSRQKCYS